MSFLSKTLFSLLTATVLCSSFGYSGGYNNDRQSKIYNDFDNINDTQKK